MESKKEETYENAWFFEKNANFNRSSCYQAPSRQRQKKIGGGQALVN